MTTESTGKKIKKINIAVGKLYSRIIKAKNMAEKMNILEGKIYCALKTVKKKYNRKESSGNIYQRKKCYGAKSREILT